MRTALFPAILLILLAGFLQVAVGLPFGKPARTDMDDYFLAHAQDQAAANNVVTSVVFDFRGYDTMGEAFILIVSVTGALAILRKSKNRWEGD